MTAAYAALTSTPHPFALALLALTLGGCHVAAWCVPGEGVRRHE